MVSLFGRGFDSLQLHNIDWLSVTYKNYALKYAHFLQFVCVFFDSNWALQKLGVSGIFLILPMIYKNTKAAANVAAQLLLFWKREKLVSGCKFTQYIGNMQIFTLYNRRGLCFLTVLYNYNPITLCSYYSMFFYSRGLIVKGYRL